jgi:hypothetical protein
MSKHTLGKRMVFVCPKCSWQSPGGWMVGLADCPWCKIPMDKKIVEIKAEK